MKVEQIEQGKRVTIVSESKKTRQLYAAIVKFQSICPVVVPNKSANITKEGKSGYKYFYADLSHILQTIQAAKAEAALGTLWVPSMAGTIVLKIVHADSGQWIEGSLHVESSMKDAKSIGSAISYAKRYLIVAMLGIPVGDDEDDDGTAAGGGNNKKKSSYTAPTPEPVAEPQREVVKFELSNDLELSMVNAASLEELATIYNELPSIGKNDAQVQAMKEKHKQRLLAQDRKGAQNG